MSGDRKPYGRPELMEMGSAQALTLGAVGCQPDDTKCEYWKWEEAGMENEAF